ncbi:MAG: ABC transporter substrate-binding protein [Chloroflexi bacterium]|nr:ABC transporter substrate-binding protein [Chloroflexota bacterium]
MHGGSLFVSASCLTVVSLLLASCSPAVAPTPTPKPAAPAPSRAADATAPPKAAATPVAGATAPPKPVALSPTPKPSGEQPRYGGVLTVSVPEDPIHFDLHQAIAGATANVLMCAYSGLTQNHPEKPQEIIGDLAKSWDLSKDGLTLTFQLHENVLFHNGRPLAAEDVRYSYERQINPPRGVVAPRRPNLEAINKVEAPDKATVRFTLAYPSGSLLAALGLGWMGIYSKELVEQKGHMKNDVMGTGPFKLKRYTPGISVEHVKFTDYFVKGRPYLDGITFYIIRDASTRLAALRAGQIKQTGLETGGLDPSDAEALRKTGSPVKAVPYNGMRFAQLIINTQQQPWSDVRVRQAVHLAVDRQAAISVLEQGYGQLGSNFPGEWGVPQDELTKVPGYRQPKDADIAEARRLLAEAGYPNGFRSAMLVRSGRAYEAMGVFMADQLARIDIKLDLEVKESAVRTTLLNQGNYKVHPHPSPSFHIYDPDNVARYWAKPVGDDWGQNWQRSTDQKIWDLLDKQARALDPAERKKLVRELDLRMTEVAARPVFYWGMNLMGQLPEVMNMNPPLGWYSGFKFQDVWLAK